MFFGTSSLPPHLSDLLDHIETSLRNLLPDQTMETVFHQPLQRQVILNLYPLGKGISPHIDLPHRYTDGILGVSLMGGCVMNFTPHDGDKREKGCGYDTFIPPRSVYILTGPARLEWAHGIRGTLEDLVREEGDGGGVETVIRGVRVSVTYRWIKEAGDVLL